MNTPDIDIDGMLKRLHLANAHRAWRELVARAEKERRSLTPVIVVEARRQRGLVWIEHFLDVDIEGQPGPRHPFGFDTGALDEPPSDPA